MNASSENQVTIVGGGFCGLAAAYELARNGIRVVVLEAERELGGLASSFEVGGRQLNRFYHHWFTSDAEVMELIAELGLQDRIEVHPTSTGMYYNRSFFRLSSPWDLLRFTPLRPADRIRLGLMTLRARRVNDWHALESRTAREWIEELGGPEVYRVVFQPLLQGKFGPCAERISAVWFWNKLKLRGGSRGRRGEERLAYFRGGFVALAEAIAGRIREMGGRIELSAPVKTIEPAGEMWHAVTPQGAIVSRRIVATTPLPLTADMVRGWAGQSYVARLERIRYLGNICLVLELDRALSTTYWLNVNDPSFPFVGVIEHTNFVRPEIYGGRHIVYLSKYLPHTDRLYGMTADEFLDYALPFLQTMFPAMERRWILAHHLWRARWSQPVVEKHYSRLLPAEDGPVAGLHLCSMAQIYPEDRGTNYAIREGRRLGARIAGLVARPGQEA